jgi:hypothetical protein
MGNQTHKLKDIRWIKIYNPFKVFKPIYTPLYSVEIYGGGGLFYVENFRSTEEWNFVFELKGILEFHINGKKFSCWQCIIRF